MGQRSHWMIGSLFALLAAGAAPSAEATTYSLDLVQTGPAAPRDRASPPGWSANRYQLLDAATGSAVLPSFTLTDGDVLDLSIAFGNDVVLPNGHGSLGGPGRFLTTRFGGTATWTTGFFARYTSEASFFNDGQLVATSGQLTNALALSADIFVVVWPQGPAITFDRIDVRMVVGQGSTFSFGGAYGPANLDVSTVPELSTTALWGLGGIALLALRRARRDHPAA